MYCLSLIPYGRIFLLYSNFKLPSFTKESVLCAYCILLRFIIMVTLSCFGLFELIGYTLLFFHFRLYGPPPLIHFHSTLLSLLTPFPSTPFFLFFLYFFNFLLFSSYNSPLNLICILFFYYDIPLHLIFMFHFSLYVPLFPYICLTSQSFLLRCCEKAQV